MSLLRLITKLQDLNIHLEAENGNIVCLSPKASLTSELKAEITRHKVELQSLLQKARVLATAEASIAQKEMQSPSTVDSAGLGLLSMAQLRLWLLLQVNPRAGIQNIPLAFELQGGEPDTLRLCRALQHLVRRHESLRTVFINVDGFPRRQVVPSLEMPFEEIDLVRLSRKEQDERTMARARLECENLFPLETGPLLRSVLLRLSKTRHVLFITFHHLIFDRFALPTLMSDLATAYTGSGEGRRPQFDSLGSAYGDFVAEQRAWLDSSECDLQAQYWRGRLAGSGHPLALPLDRARQEISSFKGGSCPIHFSSELTERLHTTATAYGLDLYSILLTGFFGLLNRYTTQRDLIVGSPFIGSHAKRAGAALGLFSNTLALRCQIKRAMTFRELLAHVDQRVQEARDNGDYPFERVLNDHQGERDLCLAGLFQVLFVFQSRPLQYDFKAFKCGLLAVETGVAPYDLTLDLEEMDGRLSGKWVYSEVFNRDTVACMVAHYFQFLSRSLLEPDRTIETIDYLSDEERRRMLVHWNDTHITFRDSRILIERFEAQVAATPGTLALICTEQELSYGELNEKANQLGHYLLAQGIGPEAVVAVCLRSSLESALAMVAVLKTGAAFCFLKPTDPQVRQVEILKDCKASLLITRRHFLQNIPKARIEPVILDDLQQVLANYPNTNPLRILHPQNAAYVLFTSHQGGRPKGVVISNEAVCQRLSRMQEHYRLRKTDRMLWNTPPNLNGSVWSFFLPLSVGASCVLDDMDRLKSTAYLVKIISEKQITIFYVMPPLLEAFLQQPDTDRCLDLQKVICGGESLPLRVYKRFYECFRQTELYNLYGPLESVGGVTQWYCSENWSESTIPIGRPLANIRIYLLDELMQPVPVGVRGELHIGGGPSARGYLNMPALTAEKFIPDPFSSEAGVRLYKSGDLAKFMPDGKLEIVGRIDDLVKIRGYRVELGEIEAILKEQPDINNAVAMVRQDQPGQRVLVAYFTTPSGRRCNVDGLRLCMQRSLPDYMVPAEFRQIDEMPTVNGRVNRTALPSLETTHTEWEAAYPRSLSEVERVIIKIWKDVLDLEKIGQHDDFFELGGDSLLLVVAYHRLPDFFKQDLSLRDLFKYRTAHAVHRFLEDEARNLEASPDRAEFDRQIAERRDLVGTLSGKNIAVVGLAGRFSGCGDIHQFWDRLRSGVDCLTLLTRETLTGVVDADLLADPDYVPVRGFLDDIRAFDAAFFNFTPREAQITDPQHRIFMECVWEAMENAGYTADKYTGDIGVFAGTGANHYLKHNLESNPRLKQKMGDFPLSIGNSSENLCSRISFKFNFDGPALGIQTACSTSLVAVHQACQSLLLGDCNLAVAGGVYLGDLNRSGYQYEEGMLLSPDGRCRCFDAAAGGSVPGQGAGAVVLKPLADAVVEGDHIYAVVKGSAMSNDGSAKSGYTGYGVHGQSKAILNALKAAEVGPETIDYIETSSTASPLGDPIEFLSLTKVFGSVTRKRSCALGAVKSLVGNLDVAAGITAFIKAVLSIHHGEITPNLHFETPNPKMDFENSPFFVSTRLQKWPEGERPRRAGVSAFGLGGTNAHVILEEKPTFSFKTKMRPWELLCLSAKTRTALEAVTGNLADFLKSNPHLNIADVAYTLQVGRKDFKYRRVLVCQNRHEAVIGLENQSAGRVLTNVAEEVERPIAFMFPGQGAQYVNMGLQLYEVDPAYRGVVNQCWEMIKNQFPMFYQSLSEWDRDSRTVKIHQTHLTQLSLFVMEYALAQLLIKWGVKPQAMIGDSLGEYVAATLAGVFSLEDALMVIGIRGRLMQAMPPGEMVEVNLPETELGPYLNEQLDLARIVTSAKSIVSGHPRAVKALVATLRARGIRYRRLFSSYAFHSYMTDSLLPEYAQAVSRAKLNPPQIPFISSVTGTWLTDEQATNPQYWVRQLRMPMRFSDGIEALCREPHRIFVEVGPKKSLSAYANQNSAKTNDHIVLATMRHPREEESDLQTLLTTLGRLWLRGVPIDWNAVNSDGMRNRVPLPTYPFERKPYWINARRQGSKAVVLEPEEYSGAEDELSESPLFRSNVSINFIEPRDAVEQTIADAWRDFLGLDRIGVHDDFFELGGSSLVAVRLINQLNRIFEVPLATHILLQKRTIATLAELIKENTGRPGKENTGRPGKTGDSTSALVEIQPGHLHATPLYLVHPIGGEVYFYRELAQYLGANQPVFAYQAQSLLGKVASYTNMEQQAEAYVEELLSVRPNPPYILGGASYGGVVAFEMARQLQARGVAVPLVVMIDSPGPDKFQENVTNDYAEILDYLVGDELSISVDELRELEPEEQLNYIFEKARVANRFNALPPALGIPMFKTWMGHQEALQNYRPTAYSGRVVFFRASERLKFNTTDMHISWIDLVTGGIEIYQIPGNHLTMNFAPNVKIMSNYLKRILKSL